jgi:hypothetical protein
MTPPPTQPCRHDYDNPVKKGRGLYLCPKCDADISLEVLMLAEAEWEAQEKKLRAKHRAGIY